MGQKKSCVKFQIVPISGNPPGLRCVKFKKGLASPVVPSQGLVEGGRSQYYIRRGKSVRATATRSSRAAPKRKASRKSRR
jgi:hypothetical protein